MDKRYRIALVPNRYAIRVYDKDDPDPVNYRGIGQLDINGHKGAMHSLHGEGFYHALHQVGIQPFIDLGLHTISVCMTKEHYKLLRRQLRGRAKVAQTGEFFHPEFKRMFVEADITALTT